MLNLLAGGHKDWDGDGEIAALGDGYGLLNGDQLGYIQAVYSHADYAVNSFGASRNMIVNGEFVKICTQNLARWAPELRDQLLTILNAASISEMDSAVQRSAALADQMLNGIDVSENGTVEPASGECGVLLAAEDTYRMADMPLLPVNPVDTPIAVSGTVTTTPTPTLTFGRTASSTPRQVLSTNTPAGIATNPPPPTDPPPPPPTRRPHPTRKPKPTKRP
jgi:hypothetical protein